MRVLDPRILLRDGSRPGVREGSSSPPAVVAVQSLTDLLTADGSRAGKRVVLRMARCLGSTRQMGRAQLTVK